MRGRFIILFISLPGLLFAQEYQNVFVFLNNKADKEVISVEEQEALQSAHMKNIDRLVSEGKMVVAGPFDGGGGLFIFKSEKVAEVREWLSTDPAVKANRWNIEMFPIRFLKGNACLANEPYEMVTYNFVRVRLINDIANYKMNQGDRDIWRHLQNHQQAIMVGVFPHSDGGVIVYSGERKNLWFGDNQEDQINLEQKTLWVAKGSFCE